MNHLERFHETMRHNKELVAAFNKFAHYKGVSLYEDATRVEHECDFLRISYRVVEGRFSHYSPMPDLDSGYSFHFLNALTFGQAMPEHTISSTGMGTVEEQIQWREACDAAKLIKPPLAT